MKGELRGNKGGKDDEKPGRDESDLIKSGDDDLKEGRRTRGRAVREGEGRREKDEMSKELNSQCSSEESDESLQMTHRISIELVDGSQQPNEILSFSPLFPNSSSCWNV